MSSKDLKMVAFQLPLKTYKKLQFLAEKNYRSISAEIRIIITSYIDSLEIDIGDTNDNNISI